MCKMDIVIEAYGPGIKEPGCGDMGKFIVPRRDIELESPDTQVKVVIVHGYLETYIVDLLANRPNARFLEVHKNDSSIGSINNLKAHKDQIGDKSETRIYGLTLGWDNLGVSGREKLLRYLAVQAEEEPFPKDSDIQKWLGLGSPISELIMRVSLEAARKNVRDGKPSEDIKRFLAPLLQLQPANERLAEALQCTRNVIENEQAELLPGIEKALTCLGRKIVSSL
jgi:hypothetical protein